MLRNISPLTSVRFFLACFVMFHHSVRIFLPVFSARSVNGIPEDFLGIVSFAFPGSVSFFFLLSGYVLSLVYLRDGPVIDMSRFFAARFARLYPLYFVTLVLATPELLATEVQRHGMKIGSIKTAEIFATNVAMVQAWYPSRLQRINPPSWSLCGEVFFYVCFPLLGALLWRLRGSWLPMTALTLYIAGQVLVWKMRTQIRFDLAMVLPPFHLSTFALGILLARWQTLQQDQNRKRQIRVWQASAVLALSAGGTLLSVFMVPFFRMPAPIYNDGLLAPLFVGFIWGLSAISTPLSRWLCARWLVALGNSSYALYLIHTPILSLFQHLHWVTRSFYPVYLGLCVVLSLLSFHYFETPVRYWLLERLHARLLRNIPEKVSMSPHGSPVTATGIEPCSPRRDRPAHASLRLTRPASE
jgi:peptidoglycan/LPS O-acetylase OafA/YrhL